MVKLITDTANDIVDAKGWAEHLRESQVEITLQALRIIRIASDKIGGTDVSKPEL